MLSVYAQGATAAIMILGIVVYFVMCCIFYKNSFHSQGQTHKFAPYKDVILSIFCRGKPVYLPCEIIFLKGTLKIVPCEGQFKLPKKRLENL